MTDVSNEMPLSHDAAFAELGALAIGALEDAEESRVRAHVDTCAVCSAELQAMMRVRDSMPQAPPAGTMTPDVSASIRARLMTRAAADTPRGAVTARRATGRLLLLAAALVIVALGLGYYNQYAARRELVAAAANLDSVIAGLQSQLRDRDAELAAITGPGVSVVELSTTGVRPPTARMFWDRATNRWTLFAHGLARPGAGRTYELWLVTADKKIPAGIFKPDAEGSAVVRATYALQPTELKAIAITEEPDGGVSAPTGSVILAGTVGS